MRVPRHISHARGSGVYLWFYGASGVDVGVVSYNTGSLCAFTTLVATPGVLLH